ncbi:hypothetical protein BJV78DRAFT_405648 [Lactifluus subvellereus]|nr:hypothetical protein BJV78DRAFT_405648 [Lactifluus subvellereus]
MAVWHIISLRLHERSFVSFMLLSPLLFLAPDDYLRDVEILQTDDIIISAVWKSSMTRLLGNDDHVPHSSRDCYPVGCHFYSQCGLSCYPQRSSFQSQQERFDEREPSDDFHISCPDRQLPLNRNQRGKHCDWRSPQPYQPEDPAGASTYSYQNTHKLFGLEPMTIIFSLPWALLMWSVYPDCLAIQP